MKRGGRRLSPALLLAFALCTCGSPRTHFYALAVIAPAGPILLPCEATPLAVEHVRIPETLDRQSMVSANGPNQLNISNQDRWAAPLDGMIQRVLAEDLRARLRPGSVLAPGDPEPPGGGTGLEVNVLRFLPDADGHISLDADWALLDRRGARRLSRSEALTAAAPRGAPVAAGMSRALGAFADRIAAALAACPGTPELSPR